MAMCCFVGCSEEDSASSSSSSKSSGKSKRLVPTTAAEVMASTDYKLEHTTKSGIKCYVRPLTPEIAKSISEDSPDHEFLNGDDDGPFYFLVLIRNGKIIDTEAATAGAMTAAEGGEVMGFVMGKDPKLKQMLKETGKK